MRAAGIEGYPRSVRPLKLGDLGVLLLHRPGRLLARESRPANELPHPGVPRPPRGCRARQAVAARRGVAPRSCPVQELPVQGCRARPGAGWRRHALEHGTMERQDLRKRAALAQPTQPAVRLDYSVGRGGSAGRERSVGRAGRADLPG